MEARFTNGSSVNRVFESETATELLGVFQYETDALQFATTKLAEDAERGWWNSKYIIAHGLTGTIKIVRHEKKPEAKAA